MWIVYAFCSAFFAGITAILAKIGLKETDSDLATALRTVVVLIFSWAIVFLAGSQKTIGDITLRTLLFLILSGLSTGASWLCYFKAIQLGEVNKVAPVDKSSTILTMIMAFLFLGEKISLFMLLGMFSMAVGTVLMLLSKKVEDAKESGDEEEKAQNEKNDLAKGERFRKYTWFLFAIGSAVFASLTAILGKIGIEGVEPNLGTAIRTIVVLAMTLLIVWKQGKLPDMRHIPIVGWIFILLSGVSTGLSWICYYHALKDGYASVVVPIDKLSIAVTVLFSYLFLKEKLERRSWIGLACIIGGTLCLLL